MKIELLCNNIKNPLGVFGKPFFGWKCNVNPDDGKTQISYQVKVITENEELIWDSGVVKCTQNNYIKYEGNDLLPCTKYLWQVSLETQTGIYESEKAYFVTGLAKNEWTAKWISTDATDTAPILYKEFEIEKVDKEVYAYVCGLGYFELIINGKKVGDDYFVPNWTDYDSVEYIDLKYAFNGKTRKRLNYLIYEVSKYLQKGKNIVEIWLGNGLFKQERRITEGKFNYGELKAIFQLKGDNILLLSDETWKARTSQIIENNVFYGEVYDNTAVSEALDIHVAKEPVGEFLPQFSPADKVSEVIKITTHNNNIYDAKKVMSGFAGFKCSGKRGTKVEIYYAETLTSDGELDFTSTVGYEPCDENQIQKDVYILSGEGVEEFIPRFVWHGFRYFKIVSQDVEIFDVRAYYVHSAVRLSGEFYCSDENLNKIHSMYHNSLKSNIHGAVPSDCPHRERLAYTGDGQVASDSAMYNYDMYNFYKKWIYDMLDAQNESTGFVPHTAPFMGGGGGPAWGCAIVIVPWNLYRHYHDKQILKDTVAAMQRWINYLKTRKNEDGLVYKEESGSWCLGEWCLPADFPWSEPRFEDIKIPSELVNTSFYVYCLKIYKNVLGVLGLDENAADVEIQNTEDAINKAFLNEYYSAGIQGCDVFPLRAGVVPTERVKDITEHIKRIFEDNGYCMDTGLLGTRFLFEVLSEYDMNDVAYRLLKTTEYPSYGHMVKSGATSIWETWEGTGSMSHQALISFDSWLYYGLAGIKIDSLLQTDEITIKPYFPHDLDFVKTKMSIPNGDVAVEWERKDGSICLSVEIPFNTKAVVCTGDGEKVHVECGKHVFFV